MSQPTVDDEHERLLIARIAAGERAALATLYRGYHRRLVRFLAKLTRDADLIEEVINDCFWIVWQKAGSFRGDSRLSTWIMGIAYRCALKALRQHGKDDPAEDSAEAAAASVDPHGERELQDWLNKGLMRLSTDQRVVINLVYADGYSMEEVAAIMQCPVGTVKARLFHARVKLRNLLPTLAQPQASTGGVT